MALPPEENETLRAVDTLVEALKECLLATKIGYGSQGNFHYLYGKLDYIKMVAKKALKDTYNEPKCKGCGRVIDHPGFAEYCCEGCKDENNDE